MYVYTHIPTITLCLWHTLISKLFPLYTAVLTIPKIISSSGSEVCTTINDDVSVSCSFNASTLDGATIVVWLKDYSAISGYDNETRPVQGVDNVVISILHIKHLSYEDQGKYTCYCYYNRSMVTSDNLVTSDQATVMVHTDCASGKSKDELAIINEHAYNTFHFREQYSMDVGDHK